MKQVRRTSFVAVLALLPGLLVAPALAGCSHVCEVYEYSLASGIARSSTQEGALRAYLASHDGADFPREGWTGPDDGGAFRSGSAEVSVTARPDAAGWAVTSARTC